MVWSHTHIKCHNDPQHASSPFNRLRSVWNMGRSYLLVQGVQKKTDLLQIHKVFLRY